MIMKNQFFRMNTKRLPAIVLAITLAAASAFALIRTQDWQIADGYSVAFSCNEASGIFRDVKGSIVFDENQTAVSKFDITIGVNSINTGNGLQNKHAKSDEWFNADKFPTIRYGSQKITKTAGGYSSAGELEMHGVKKPLVIPFNFQRSSAGGLFTSTFMVSRVDFGVGAPGGEVDEKIKIELKVPVTVK
jgi:polyisoprenoid-binding protein YceI